LEELQFGYILISMKNRIKIILVIITAFLTVNFVTKGIFIAGTPKPNPFFTKNFIAKINNLFLNLKSNEIPSHLVNKKGVINKDPLPQDIVDIINNSMSKVTTGVYAGEKENIGIYQYKPDEIIWEEYSYVVNGNEKKIKVPKGQEPPSQEVVGKLYQ